MDRQRRRMFFWLAASVAAVASAAVLMLAGVASAGVDSDGNLDVVFGSGPQSTLCLGDGSGGFACSDVGIGARAVEVGDANGDGRLDLMFGVVGGRNGVCLADGSGGFACSDVSPDTNQSGGLALGDVNSDGDLDAVFANAFHQNRVCLGNGSGGFACSDVSADTNRTSEVALGDVNSDGDLDAVFANEGPFPVGERNRVCLGDGSGAFSCSDVTSTPSSSIDVALGDINGDGNLDAVFGNNVQRNRACLGNGSGGFACGDVSPDVSNARGVALGDVNSDGDLDAVIANEGGGERNRVCLGDGSGAFSCSDVSSDTNWTWDVGLGDVDRDGDLDAVFANFNPPSGQRDRVCFGDGSGAFSCGDLSTDTKASHRLALVPGHRGRFSDDDFNRFEDDIEWMADQGITLGCNPEGTLYCPLDSVTRGQMASFLVRALDLPAVAGNRFSDVSGTHTANINALAEAGVTLGCNAEGTLFCPTDRVTREQMGSFLARALDLPPVAGNRFSDVSGTHTANINAIAEAGITLGCNPAGTLYCPRDFVTRGQMAAFLHRGLG